MVDGKGVQFPCQAPSCDVKRTKRYRILLPGRKMTKNLDLCEEHGAVLVTMASWAKGGPQVPTPDARPAHAPAGPDVRTRVSNLPLVED